MKARLLLGDCRDSMRAMDAESIDAIVSDPPYGLSFMGKGWDHGVPGQDFWIEALRVAKPGAHLLAFGGTRTFHRLVVAIEDAGWEIRDCLMWVYGSGFPKSLDVSKAIDKRGGVHAGFVEFRDAVKENMKRNGVSRAQLQDALGNFMLSHYLTAGSQPAVPNLRDYRIIRDTVRLGDEWDHLFDDEATREVVGTAKNTTLAVAPGQGTERPQTELNITAPATEAAKAWQGWGTALKPAYEPIIMARKPLTGTVAANVLRHGTGAINVDGCRVATTDDLTTHSRGAGYDGPAFGHMNPLPTRKQPGQEAGRWPANVILTHAPGCGDECATGCPVAALDAQSGILPVSRGGGNGYACSIFGTDTQKTRAKGVVGFGDTGGASRFFYCAKASKADRDEGCDGLDAKKRTDGRDSEHHTGHLPTTERSNHHPTVKPTDLMRYLCRLVTPPGGTVLDPFMGSGSTGKAATLEGFSFVGCELQPEYMAIAEARIRHAEGEVEPLLRVRS